MYYTAILSKSQALIKINTSEMKIKHILNEKLTRISADVDMIYNRWFKDAYDHFQKTKKADPSLFGKGVMSTDNLKSLAARKADAIQPITIQVNMAGKEGNFYQPETSVITLNYHVSAWELAESMGYTAALYSIPTHQEASFKAEFRPEIIKGSIHHELNHWIDDVMHNRHINKHVKKARERGISPQDNEGSLERHSQIHNIVQLKRVHKNIWNSLSFNDMIKLSPSFIAITKEMSSKVFTKWRNLLMRRMHREGLLGASMKYSKPQ